MLGKEAPPKSVDVVPFRATAGLAYAGLQERGIVKVVKEPLKLCNNGRFLNCRPNVGMICVGHREADSFLEAQGP